VVRSTQFSWNPRGLLRRERMRGRAGHEHERDRKRSQGGGGSSHAVEGHDAMDQVTTPELAPERRDLT
jgi:hypothetical protein